ncbi:MAG: hypothetical protein IJG36_07940 [Synergistaceae bacterium]|nr:hypothetical protein [Synergistaceae bacterium]
MKRLLALSLILALLFSSSAFGAVKDFGKFTVNVPKGWSIDHEGSRVTLTKGRMIMEIILESTGGKSLDDIAQEIAEQYGSDDMEGIEDYNVFTYTEDGVECFGRVSIPKKGMYLLVLMCPHDNEAMFDIEDTIRVK